MRFQERDAAERARNLDAVLSAIPEGVRPDQLWLFVYGSMLDEPPFPSPESRVTVLPGWTRRFCLADPMIRGTAARPGLTLGLEPGGSCAGVAWRLPSDGSREALLKVWDREMRLPFYEGRWLESEPGFPAPAVLTLVVDPGSRLHQPDLNDREIARRLASCAGENGSNLDYLREVTSGLSQRGIADPELDQLFRMAGEAVFDPA